MAAKGDIRDQWVHCRILANCVPQTVRGEVHGQNKISCRLNLELKVSYCSESVSSSLTFFSQIGYVSFDCPKKLCSKLVPTFCCSCVWVVQGFALTAMKRSLGKTCSLDAAAVKWPENVPHPINDWGFPLPGAKISSTSWSHSTSPTSLRPLPGTCDNTSPEMNWKKLVCWENHAHVAIRMMFFFLSWKTFGDERRLVW